MSLQHNNIDITRPDFVRRSLITGSGLMLSGILPLQSPETNYINSSDTLYDNDDDLKNVCDIHLHASPDSRFRDVNELEFAKDARAAGYKAVMFKTNGLNIPQLLTLVKNEIEQTPII